MILLSSLLLLAIKSWLELMIFKKKPIVNLLTWKHHLFVEKDYAKAKKSYDAAILFAQLTENINLRENLEKEWQKDSQNGT